MTDADMMLPDVITKSKRLSALVALADRMAALPIDKDLVYLIDKVDQRLLPDLAWQFHLTFFEGWGAAASEDERRRLIRQSIAIHRKKGTPWSIQQALRVLGIEVRIIDRMAQRDAYAPFHPLRLDGSWAVDGSQKIRPIEVVIGIPQIQHWARFIVITEHDQVIDPVIGSYMRRIVEEWKPVRSWPSYLSWMMFWLAVLIDASGSAILANLIHDYRYPWCGRVIGEAEAVRWPLGRDGHVVRLGLPLGSFRLGQVIGGRSSWHLRGCRIVSHLAMASNAAHIAYGLPTIGEPWRRLDGTWRLSERASALMGRLAMASRALISLPSRAGTTYGEHIRMDYPATPARLTRAATLAPWRRLDGRWRIGEPIRPQPFGFALRRGKPIMVSSHLACAMRDDMRVNPERLTRPITIKMGRRRHLDGSWHLGDPFLTGPRLGRFRLPLNDTSGGVDARDARHLPVDGSWHIGGPAAPLFRFNITERAHHG